MSVIRGPVYLSEEFDGTIGSINPLGGVFSIPGSEKTKDQGNPYTKIAQINSVFDLNIRNVSTIYYPVDENRTINVISCMDYSNTALCGSYPFDVFQPYKGYISIARVGQSGGFDPVGDIEIPDEIAHNTCFPHIAYDSYNQKMYFAASISKGEKAGYVVIDAKNKKYIKTIYIDDMNIFNTVEAVSNNGRLYIAEQNREQPDSNAQVLCYDDNLDLYMDSIPLKSIGNTTIEIGGIAVDNVKKYYTLLQVMLKKRRFVILRQFKSLIPKHMSLLRTFHWI
ncbi:hypothetical protein ACFO72_004567 [Enterobacter roggenkampii]